MTFEITFLTLLKANSTDTTVPWFDVLPNHTIMLSGFPPKGLCIRIPLDDPNLLS